MNKIRLLLIFLTTAVMTLQVLAQSDRRAQRTPSPWIAPQTTPQLIPRQEYRMVTDVLDGLGGESESDNYTILVNSGAQPSVIGASDSQDWRVEAGYVSAIRITRGDINADGIINVGDVVCLVNYLYKLGDEPCPVEAGDVNGDCTVNVGDVVSLVNYLYRGGAPPPC
jgi:hypothetical protein